MSGFNSRWAIYQKYYKKTAMFRLMRDLSFISKDGAAYILRAGFLSDLGSVPRILWVFAPRDEFPSAYFLHDYLCESDWISRLDGDKLLYEALLNSHCPKWKAKIIYWGVRLYAVVRRIK